MDSNSREISNHINGGSDESTQNKAQRYLQQHNLEPLLAEMLNTLVYEKVKKPEIFMIKYLSGVLSEEEKISHGIHITKGQSAFPSSKPIVSYPSQSNNEVLKRNLTKDLWNNLKYNKSKYGANIMDILKDEKAGLTLVDSDVSINLLI